MLNPTEILEHEHRLIAKAVGIIPVWADQLEKGQAVSVDTLQDAVDFMRTFADKIHHGKEEYLLFPALIEHGVPSHGCPIGALAAEHGEGRELVRSLAEATEALRMNPASGRDALISSLRGIAELYPNHIWKEDFLLFPMTHKVLNSEGLQGLHTEFERVDAAIGRDTYQHFVRWAEQFGRGDDYRRSERVARHSVLSC